MRFDDEGVLPGDFREDAEYGPKAKALSGKVYEFSQFLVKALGVEDVGANHEGKVTYHPSCHLLRELEAKEEPVSLLKGVRGLGVRAVGRRRDVLRLRGDVFGEVPGYFRGDAGGQGCERGEERGVYGDGVRRQLPDADSGAG